MVLKHYYAFCLEILILHMEMNTKVLDPWKTSSRALLTAGIAIFVLISVIPLTHLFAESSDGDLITWLPYDVAVAKAKKENKHLIINFTTSWCGWCKKMKATTYADPQVVKTIGTEFVAAKVDGDSYNVLKLVDGDITEKGLTVQYGVRGYPTTWFLEPNGNKIAPAPGYIDVTAMQYILDFVGGNYNDEMAFTDYINIQKKLETLRPAAKIKLGMTSSQVKAAWGAPEKVEPKSVDKGQSVEDWFYSGNQVLTFKNSKLHGFQERQAAVESADKKTTP